MRRACFAILMFCAALPLHARNKNRPAPSRFKPKLLGRFYAGVEGDIVTSDAADVKKLVGSTANSELGAGADGKFRLGYQFASGWAVEAGWESLSRYITVDYGYTLDDSYTFAEKTWYVEPVYRMLFGRRFTLGLGTQLGLTQDKVTEKSLGVTTDASGGGAMAMPELKAQVLAGGLVGFEFNLGYRFQDASPIKGEGFTVTDNTGARDWHISNSGWSFGAGINVHFGRVTTRPGPEQGKGRINIPIQIEGAENLPKLKEWSMQVLSLDGKVLKEFEGQGPLPRQLSWDALDPQGKALDPDSELQLRLTTTDSFGASSVTEAGLGEALKPRAFQASAPLLAMGADGKGAMTIATQFKRNTPQVRAWKLKITDADGKILKTFEGKEVLPRSLKWDGLDAAGRAVAARDVHYSFEASDENGPVFDETGKVAGAIKPRELMAKPPRYDAGSGQIVFMPQREVSVPLRAWTLSLKAADGKILKVINGEGPLPKEFRFKPEELQAEGVNLGKLDSGAAFIQYSLLTVDKDGTQSSASDALALDDEFGQGALSAGDYQVRRGKEVLLLSKPMLLSPDPDLAKKGSLLLDAPQVEGQKSWRLLVSGATGRALAEFKGQGPLPTTLLWDGHDMEGKPAADPSKVSYALYATGADGVEVKGGGERTLTRSFQYEGKGVKVRRVHAAWFAQGESEIQPEMFGRLERVADWLLQDKAAKVLIQGHSSKEGDSRFNDRLALQRASTVKGWLVDVKKVPEAQVQLRGYGTRMLLDEGESEDAVRRNRRIDVLLLEWPD